MTAALDVDTTLDPPTGVVVDDDVRQAAGSMLSAQALALLASLHRSFDPARRELLAVRERRWRTWRDGHPPDFLAASAVIRDDEWTVAPIPDDLRDRRVELDRPATAVTGDDVHTGARTLVANFAALPVPDWPAIVAGHEAVQATARTRGDTDSQTGALVAFTPRPWPARENHVRVDNDVVPAMLFDLAVAAVSGVRHGVISDIRNHLEARLWQEILSRCEAELGLPADAIGVTVRIDTFPALFEIDEIVRELRGRAVALRYEPDRIARSRARLAPTPVADETAFLASATVHVLRHGHRRGLPVIYVPAGDQAVAGDDAAALTTLCEDIARRGFDGVVVSATDLVSAAVETFDRLMPVQNQLAVMPDGEAIGAEGLLTGASGDAPKGDGAADLTSVIDGLAAMIADRDIDTLRRAEAADAAHRLWRRHRMSEEGAGAFGAMLAAEMATRRQKLGSADFVSARLADVATVVRATTLAPSPPPSLSDLAYDLLVETETLTKE